MDYSYNIQIENISDISALLAIFLGIFLILALLCICNYVLTGVAYYKMAKKLDLENKWLAWIPVGQKFLLGKIAGDRATIFGKELRDVSIVLLAITLAAIALSIVPIIGVLLSIASIVMYYITLYKVLRIFKEESAVLYLVLSIVFAITILFQPILLLVLSRKEPNLIIFTERQEYPDEEEYDEEYELEPDDEDFEFEADRNFEEDIDEDFYKDK